MRQIFQLTFLAVLTAMVLATSTTHAAATTGMPKAKSTIEEIDLLRRLVQVKKDKESGVVDAVSRLAGGNAMHQSFYDICDQVSGALGYPCEHHVIQTSDGFLLDTIRIPPKNASAYPIVLQHGLIDSAITWVANYHADQNLGCLLHDEGYDVWMPNSRGNHYSMGNTHYTQSDSEYWRRIDMDDMAKHDLPAVINYVTNHTASPTLGWVGHSQGTWQAFTAFGNVAPEMAAKVDVFVALAPVAYVAHQTSFLLSLLADFDFAVFIGIFGEKEFLTNDWLLRQFTKYCKKMGETCPSVLELLCGDGNPANVNRTQMPVIMRYDPGGTSVNNMVHWEQEVQDKTWAAHNYGFLENEKLYGSLWPPNYHAKNMTHPPTYLFSGSRDALADPKDVQWLVDHLPNGTLVQHEVIKDFAHLDFVWGLDAAKDLYKPYVIPALKKHHKP